MKIKVIIVIDHLDIGGAQNQVLEYLRHADKSQFDIKIVYLEKQRNALVEVIEKLGYVTIGLAHKGFFNMATIIQLRKLFCAEQPHIVHTYLFTSDCYGRVAARLAKVPHIITSMRSIDDWKKPHHVFVDQILAKWTDVITINADVIRPYLVDHEKIDAKKIVKIYNGIDLTRFDHVSSIDNIKASLEIPTGAKIVGMVGRLTHQKDYDTYLESAKIVLQKVPNVYFLVVGDGPRRQELETKVKNEGLGQNIIFTGTREDVAEIIHTMDIGVLSSFVEGCPNALIEYMACRKPAVAADIGGCAEVIQDEKTGFIVAPKNAQLMADRLVQLLESDDLRRQMGEEGRKRVEECFTVEKLAQNTENLYRSLAEKKVGFVFSQFPCYDETFILREMNQLKSTGLNLQIYSLKTPRDEIMHEEAKDLAKDTVYLPFISLKVFFINILFLIKHPIKYVSAFGKVFWGNRHSFDFWAKTLVVWPKAVGFAWLMKKNNIGHVHGQWATFPATVAMIISKLTGIPFSFTGHAHDIYLDTTMLADKLTAAKFVTTCTTDNKNHLEKIWNGGLQSEEEKTKIKISYHGIDLTRFRNEDGKPTEEDKEVFHILSVGSLLKCKGFAYLIEACNILKEQGLNFKCTIAGGGKLEGALRSQIAALGLKECVDLTGYITQDKLIPLYQTADIFVLAMVPEIHWGIPNVLVEAVASRLPTVCTMLPSVPELIEDGKTGFIVPPKNPQAIADVVNNLYVNKDLREHVKNSGRRVVEEKFDTVKNAMALKNIFLEGV